MSAPLPLLLVPGLLCDARVFDRQVGALPDAHAVSGHGVQARLADMADTILAAAPPRFALLGHSMGARVAIEMWRRAPERVDRLALVSTGTHLPRPGEAEKRRALLATGRDQGMAALVDAWLPPMFAPAHRDDRALTDPSRTMCIDQGVDAYAAQIEALLARPEIDSLLPTIDVPVLVAVGDQDGWAPPEQHAAFAARIPAARLVVVPGAGHMLPVEAPQPFNAAIRDWLAAPHPNGETR
ncbi:alpha/beta hydrolase [Sphingomonas spermidinifaciens]|uniref:Alpha/beta hydrolase n=1 Tax=Sphingomonas spermidinifaciens TaxID=1141889 RepID=A0A2A4B2R9_9SPHN|nr:alpha/beta fold hydrolase [Sphingomonas spermidinifaciens]PCD01984.1 alpha/beta hydrolase [Sphingomonas spermidinifaciens]